MLTKINSKKKGIGKRHHPKFHTFVQKLFCWYKFIMMMTIIKDKHTVKIILWSKNSVPNVMKVNKSTTNTLVKRQFVLSGPTNSKNSCLQLPAATDILDSFGLFTQLQSSHVTVLENIVVCVCNSHSHVKDKTATEIINIRFLLDRILKCICLID